MTFIFQVGKPPWKPSHILPLFLPCISWHRSQLKTPHFKSAAQHSQCVHLGGTFLTQFSTTPGNPD